MNRGGGRRSTPKVKDGKVQKKNRWEQSPNYYMKDRSTLLIERRNPGKGYRHLLTRQDIEAFIEIIPDWKKLSAGLNAIVLAPGEDNTAGYHVPGVLHVCAWEDELWRDWDEEFVEEHSAVLENLCVPQQKTGEKEIRCFFNEENAKAWQLLHIFMHELGHHYDRMTSRRKECSVRGEHFAEDFALKYERILLPLYVSKFRPSFARRKKGS